MSGIQKHSHYEELISASLDGALCPEEAQELEAHLSRCRNCAAYRELLRGLHNQLSDALISPPEKLHKDIQYQVELEASRRRFRPSVYVRVGTLAAVLCLVLFGVLKLVPAGRTATAAGPLQRTLTLAPAAAGEGDTAPEDGVQAEAAEGSMAAQATAEALPEAAEEPMYSAYMAPEANTGMQEAMPMPAPDALPQAEDNESFATKEIEIRYRTEQLPGREIYDRLDQAQSYYSVLICYDTLPEEIRTDAGCEPLAAPEGQQRWLVPQEVLLELELAEHFDEIHYGDLMAEYSLVIVMKEG